ncbi:hypothetical protein RND71_042401 [Anisodus tanguticus]|uniref:Uncharacterized protein n=1 Tax=Anisodus tanguticus TaxID=243964 RepID=A0AAE1UUS2_9SOLA|nr:hypothetical protein RND71_042401 [Anisodus tanguticus]
MINSEADITCFLFYEIAVTQVLVLQRYWLSVGAQPSEPVQRLLFRAGVLPPPMGQKGGPRDTRPVDPMTGRIVTPESAKPKVGEDRD